MGKVVTLLRAENKRYTSPFGYIPVPGDKNIRLRMTMPDGYVTFAWATDDVWHEVPETIDASFLSDEACNEGWFTGTMVGLCCQDLTGSRKYADFDDFRMSNRVLTGADGAVVPMEATAGFVVPDDY